MDTEEGDMPVRHLLTLDTRDTILHYVETIDTAEDLKIMLDGAYRVQHAIAEEFSHAIARPLPDIGVRYAIGRPYLSKEQARPLVCTRDGSVRLTPQNSDVYTPNDMYATLYAPVVGVAHVAEPRHCAKLVKNHVSADAVYEAILDMPQEAWLHSTLAA
jgi:hypothetical protein